jgi:hypothetical protein
MPPEFTRLVGLDGIGGGGGGQSISTSGRDHFSGKKSKIDLESLSPGRLYTQLSAIKGTLTSAGANSYYAIVDGSQGIGQYVFSDQVSPPILISTTFTVLENPETDRQYVYIERINGLNGITGGIEDASRYVTYGNTSTINQVPETDEQFWELYENSIEHYRYPRVKNRPLKTDFFMYSTNNLTIYQDDVAVYVFINGQLFDRYDAGSPTAQTVGIWVTKGHESVLKNRVRLDNSYLATDKLAVGFFKALNNANIDAPLTGYDVKLSGGINGGKSRSNDLKFQIAATSYNYQTVDLSVSVKQDPNANLVYPAYINVTYTVVSNHFLERDGKVSSEISTTSERYDKQYYVESADTVIRDSFPLEYLESRVVGNILGSFKEYLSEPPSITAFVTGVSDSSTK